MAVLQKGSSGADVTSMQIKLKYLGYDLGEWGIDGEFGSDTEAAVKKFQADAGITSTGVVGTKTARALKHCYKAEGLVGQCKYIFGAETSLSDPHPKALDCSEFVQWDVYQVAGRVFVDGSYNQYSASTATSASPMSGDLVFFRDSSGKIYHVGMVTRKQKGVWRVVHAKGRLYGVVNDPLTYFTSSSKYAGRRYIPSFIRGVSET